MKPCFDRSNNRRDSDSVKWNRYPPDVLPLWVADMDFLSPRSVLEALDARIKHGIFGYAESHQEACIAVCHWLLERYQWPVSPDQVVLLPGVVPGFNLAAQAFAEPGKGVIIQPPVYRPFFDVASHASLVQQEAPLRQDSTGRYHFSPGIFAACLQQNSRIFMLCNPHNPTGRVFSKHELLSMAELCLKHQILICSDEIHADLVYPGFTHQPIASLSSEIADITVTLLSPSKTFNIAGLKASAAVITNPALRKLFEKSRRGLLSSINLLGAAALSAAYQQGSPWLDQLIAYLDSNRNYLASFVENELPGCKMALPEGTFLAWIDCRETGLENPQQFFLDHARVALNPGDWFGPSGAGFVRLNFGCPQDLLTQALNRMKAALQNIS